MLAVESSFRYSRLLPQTTNAQQQDWKLVKRTTNDVHPWFLADDRQSIGAENRLSKHNIWAAARLLEEKLK
jgi:hypothetical protein